MKRGAYMNLENIKNPWDVYKWIDENIKYGWIDIDRQIHNIEEMKGFRKLYRTMSIDDILKYKIGTCIEQAALTHYLLDLIKIENKMFCCRIFEPDDYGNLEEEEHMHCFVLFNYNRKTYQLEHANFEKKGIYEYPSEETAIKNIVQYYIELRGGKQSPTTPFYEVPSGLSFKEFNAYINHQ